MEDPVGGYVLDGGGPPRPGRPGLRITVPPDLAVGTIVSDGLGSLLVAGPTGVCEATPVGLSRIGAGGAIRIIGRDSDRSGPIRPPLPPARHVAACTTG